MNRIIFPLQMGMNGQTVADLQDGLRLLLEKGVIPLDDADRQAFAERLHAERAEQRYDEGSAKLVALFQAQQHLSTSGEVDEPTALAFNKALEGLGALPQVPDRIPGLPIGGIGPLPNLELLKRKAQELLQPAPKGTVPSLGDLLRTMPRALPESSQLAVATVVAQSSVDYGTLSTQLAAGGLSPAQIVGVERTLRLGDLTRKHEPLVRHLQEITSADGDASLQALAKIKRFEWIDKAYTYGLPSGSNLTPEAYARQVEADVEALNPTAVLAARFNDKSLRVQQLGFTQVGDFLTQNPTFDILTTDVRKFVESANLEGIAETAPLVQALVQALIKTQRLKKLAATWEETGRLLNAGVESALDLVNMGREPVRTSLARLVSPERADLLYDRAKTQHDQALALMVNLLPRYSPTPVAALPAVNRAMDTSLLKDYPALQELFGNLDACACPHVESVLSPAAYLVDLLQFLNPKHDQRGLQALLARRPDLVDLELSAENTESELPYIDLVLEILENAAAFPRTVELRAGMDGETALNSKTLPAEIINELAQTTLTIGTSLEATKEVRKLENEPADAWTVTDGQRRWTLHSNNTDGFYLRIPGVLAAIELAQEGQETALLVGALNQGTLVAETEQRFKYNLTGALQKYGALAPLCVVSCGVTPIVPSRQWHILSRLGINIEIVAGGNNFTLYLKAPDGETAEILECSRMTASIIANGLEKGIIAGPLAELLPKDIHYTITAIPMLGPDQKVFALRANDDLLLALSYQPSQLTIDALTYQSRGNGEDLQAAAENLNPVAYDDKHLGGVSFPWTLPFNFPLEAVRAYLERAGLSRRQLIEVSTLAAEHLSNTSSVYEWLNLSKTETELISVEHADAELWKDWGATPTQQGKTEIFDAAAGEMVSGSPLTVLSRASILMQQARLSYNELLAVLATRFVDYPKLITTSGECSPSKITLDGLTSSQLDHIRRFVRLWRKVGWAISELDMALSVLSAGSGNFAKTLQRLAHIKRLQERLELPCNVLLSWWSALGMPISHAFVWPLTAENGSLYDQLFQNLFVQNPPDPAFQLNTGRDGLASGGNVAISTKATTIAAALGISQREFNLLWSDLKTLLILPDTLTLNSLFELYRAATLAQALGLSIEDYLCAKRIIGVQSPQNRINQPFESTAKVLEFCEMVAFIQHSGFSFEEVAYLLHHEITPGSTVSLSDEQASQVLADIRSALQARINALEPQVKALIQANPGGLTVMRQLTDEEAVAADMSAVAIGFALGDSSSGVTQNVTLPLNGTTGTRITWGSSNQEWVSNTGAVSRPLVSALGDVSVTLKATIVKGIATATRVFELTVRKQLTDEEAVAADTSTLTIGFAHGDSASAVTQNVMLPANGANGTAIKWTSADQALITNGGVVTRPMAAEANNAHITLTATIIKGAAATSRHFTFMVLRQFTDVEAVALDGAALTPTFAPGDDASSVAHNITLPSSGVHGTSISWLSDQPEVVDTTGKVTRPVADATNAPVYLTATLRKGAVSATKTFDLNVPRVLTDQAAMTADMATLAVSLADGDSADHVTQQVNLPTSGANSTAIAWFTSDSKIIAIDGTVNRPDATAASANITLTATITKGAEQAVKIYYPQSLLDLGPLDATRLATTLTLLDIRAQLSDVVLERVASQWSLEPGIARLLLCSDLFARAYLSHPADAAKAAIELFLEPQFVGNDISLNRSSLPYAFRLITRLQKAALLITRLNIKGAELTWLASRPTDRLGIYALCFDNLPVEAVYPGNFFAGWQRLVTLFQIRNRTVRMGALLTRYVTELCGQLENPEAVAIAKAQQVLAEGFALAVVDVQEAARQLQLSKLEHYRDPQMLAQWLDLLTVLKRFGATLEQVHQLTIDAPDEAAATTARRLLHAKYGAEAWAEVLKPVSDRLRLQRRDALVDYLVSREGLRNADVLYDYYLIDPKMDPVCVTTRLLQATHAVQLFIQRTLLNLEKNAPPWIINRDRYEWMKNYRVWEANRKVFLYPENWLHPELRDDKTQIFRQLESGMAQNEPTYQLAKDNTLNYIDELSEIAKIKVFGMYEDVSIAGERTLYVVGRSPDQPYRYYWRKGTNFGTSNMRWYGWERIEMDISTDHVMPFVLEGNLYIAWPIIKKVADNTDKRTADHWEVQLARVRHTVNGWSQKKVSKSSLTIKKEDAVDLDSDGSSSITFRLESQKAPVGENSTLSIETMHFDVFAVKIVPKLESKTPVTNPGPAQIVWETSLRNFEMDINIAVYEWDGSNYYPATNAQVTVTLFTRKLHDHESPQESSGSYDDTGATHGGAKDGGAKDGSAKPEENLEYWDSLTGWTDEQGIWCPDEKWEYAAFSGLDSMATLTIRHKGLAPIVHRFSALRYRVKSVVGCVVCNVLPDQPIGDESTFTPLGRFTLTAYDDAKIDVISSDRPKPVNIDGTRPYGNGYQNNLSNNQGGLQLPASDQSLRVPLFEAATGAFSVVQAAGADASPQNPIWHYEDGQVQLYLGLEQMSEKFDWLALVDSIRYTTFQLASAHTDIAAIYTPEFQRRTDGESALTHTPYKLNLSELSDQSIIDDGFHFGFGAPSAHYHWEVFFHTPLLLAEFLAKQQRFDDAQRWLHFVFDPTTNEPATNVERFWRFLPFQKREESVRALLERLAKTPEAEVTPMILHQIHVWEKNPFNPHAIARMRPLAYQWRTIFAYLDNLIAWGDQLFRRDTREYINEATLAYVLAARLLGPRPSTMKSKRQQHKRTYRSYIGAWDEFSNAWESFTQLSLASQSTNGKSETDLQGREPVFFAQPGSGSSHADDEQTHTLTSIGMLYFCVPANEQLLDYWDKVEDRLFKIRHSLNLEGMSRELPLFEPPIDPDLLVRATAAGLDNDSALSDLYAPLLPYRFHVLAQKASEICGEVKALGAALLATLEKKDAEELALLRSNQENELLNLITVVKDQQIEEARKNLETLAQNKAVLCERFNQYQKLLGKSVVVCPPNGIPNLEATSSLQVATNAPGETTGLALIQHEVSQLDSLDSARGYQEAAGIANTVASVLHIIPNITTAGTTQFGGSNLGSAAGAIASYLNVLSSNENHDANRANLFAQYQRRRDEWVYQSKLAVAELKQLEKQKLAAEIRVKILEKERDNHLKQIEHAQSVNEFMHTKYTNQELYSWMMGEISNVYFRTYQLAYDMAKRAERAFQHELGTEKTSFIQPGAWDSLKKGLLAGENLTSALKRMEVAYLEQNKREFELTKHISLLQLDPLALLALKENGRCELQLPEALFDLDFPGHYFRRIKTVSLTIPCVTGPYSGVNGTLTLLNNSVRVKAEGQIYKRAGQEDRRFRDNQVPIQSIAISSGQNDSGLFELNFHDERYLPFEGVGAISTWRLELSGKWQDVGGKTIELPQFDFDTISDVILHLRYTARDGGQVLKQKALQALQSAINEFVHTSGANGMTQIFSLRQMFPTEWQCFISAQKGNHSQAYALAKERFPFFFQGRKLTITSIDLFGVPEPDALANEERQLPLTLTTPETKEVQLQESAAIGQLPHKTADKTSEGQKLKVEVKRAKDSQADWTLTVPEEDVAFLGGLADIVILCRYQVGEQK